MDLFNGLDGGTYSYFHFAANDAPYDFSSLMRVGDFLGGYIGVIILLVLAVAITPPSRRRRMAVVVVTAFFLGALLVEGLKLATYRARPGDAQTFFKSAEMSASFPSRAVFLSAFAWLMLALALERGLKRPWVRVAVYLAAALGIIFVCVSELWLGLHWVTDVLAGLAGGIGLALVARWGVNSDPRDSSTHPAA